MLDTSRASGRHYQIEIEFGELRANPLEGRAAFVQFHNPETLPDDTTANNAEVLYGDQNMQRHKLTPLVTSAVLPTANLNDWFFRTRKGNGAGRLVVTIWPEKE